jgi:hypothetical protein
MNRFATLVGSVCACFVLATNSSPARQATQAPPNCLNWSTAGACTLYDVSMVRLLAEPDKFDGKRVRTAGYIHFEFEGNAIYLHEEDLTHGLLKNALWISLAEKSALPGAKTPMFSRRVHFPRMIRDTWDFLAAQSRTLHDASSCHRDEVKRSAA